MKLETKSERLALHSIRVFENGESKLSVILNSRFTYLNEILSLAEKDRGRYTFSQPHLHRLHRRSPSRVYFGEVFDVCYATPQKEGTYKPSSPVVNIPFEDWLRLGKPRSLVYRNHHSFTPSSESVEPFREV